MIDRQLLDDCVHCGFCLPTCPTYQSWGEEMDSPRGRIYLMRAPLSETAVRHFDRCLGCMHCVTACPSGVKYDALIEETRAEIEHHHRRSAGDRFFRGLIFRLFPYPARLRVLLFLQFLYVKTGLRRLVHLLGIPRLMSPRYRNLEALLPPITAHHLTASLPEHSDAEGPVRARVALLAGCVQRAYFPSVNEATIRVLTAEGCEVVVPPELGCCGALSVHAGRDEQARDLAREAIEVLERVRPDAIVINSAGCGSSMKEWGRLLRDDREYAPRAAALAGKVRDVSEFLASLPPLAERHPLPVRAAYHDACHLAHAQKIRAEPRALLRAIPGLTLGELADAESCCGSAGIYNLVEPESAREIGARKVESVLAAAPELLVSANPGCTLHIQMLLRERGHEVKTAHPIEVLDASIRGVPLA